MKNLYAYVSGPISHGDQIVNCRELVLASHALMNLKTQKASIVPFNPGASLVSHAIDPQEYEVWLKWDFAWIEQCDCLLLTRPWIVSNGRERERAYADAVGVEVFSSLWDLVERYESRLGAVNLPAIKAFDLRWCRPEKPLSELPAEVKERDGSVGGYLTR